MLRLQSFVLVVIVLAGSPVCAHAETLHLRSGDVLHGRVVGETAKSVVLDHPDLGRLTVPRDRIHRRGSPDARRAPLASAAPAMGGPRAQETATSPQAPVPPNARDKLDAETQADADRWTFRLIFGGANSNDDKGNKTRLHVRSRLGRDRALEETALNFSGLYEITNGRDTESKATAALRQRWLSKDSPWFLLGQLQYDFNEFRDWRHRVTGHIGPGLRVVDNEEVRWDLMILGGGRQDFGSEDEDGLFEAGVGTELAWSPLTRHTFRSGLYYYEGISHDRNRAVLISDYSYLLDFEHQISFNVGLDFEYDTSPDRGTPNEVYYLNFGLQLDF